MMMTSCSFLDSKEQEVTFHIPQLPEELNGLEITGYRVIVATTGTRTEFIYNTSDFKATAPVSGVTSVLAYPKVSWTTLKPSGLVLSDNLKAHNYLSWEDGFAAECTAQALASGYTLIDIDFKAFRQKLISASDGNPWILNPQKIIYALKSGNISSTYIKKSDCHTLDLPFEAGDGIWYRNTPGAIKSYLQSSEHLYELDIVEGENILINPATDTEISIYSDALTWICIYGSSKGLSGYW